MYDDFRVLVELRSQDEYEAVRQLLVAHRTGSTGSGHKPVVEPSTATRILEALRLKPATAIKTCLLETLLIDDAGAWISFVDIASRFAEARLLPAEKRVEAALREISWQMNEIFGRGETKAISLLVEKIRSDGGQSSYRLTRSGREAVQAYVALPG